MYQGWKLRKSKNLNNGTSYLTVSFVTDEERILTRLSRLERPVPPPPVHQLKAPVPEINPSMMENKTSILHLLSADLNMLRNFAG